MRLESFEEWFAIRANHQDEDHWPGRLTFDPVKGIHLTTARFAGDAESHGDPTFHTPTMTGWLDYQRPTTLIQPMIQTSGGLALGINTPAMRASYRFVVNAVLKNIFLEDINEAIFTGLVVDHPAVHAWINPNLVDHGWSHDDKSQFPVLSVEVAPPQERQFELPNGTKAIVTSAVRTTQGTVLTANEYTVLRLRFPEPISYDEITRMTWRISTVFSFLIGVRVGSPVYKFPTTHTRSWNGEEREVVAELWHRPARMGADSSPQSTDCLLVEGRSSLTFEQVLEIILGERDELVYLANVIQSVDDHDLSITHGYGEILGCLESFDASEFGSGRDPQLRDKIRSLKSIIKQHGSESDYILLERLCSGTRNSYSLLRRLERLHCCWKGDGFRGDPDLRRIRDLRNLVPHGRGLEVSSKVVHEMVTFSYYLASLGRYHVLRALGCKGDEIANAFLRQPHRYGMFVPERFLKNIPKGIFH